MIMSNPHVADKLYSELTSLEEGRAKEEEVSLIQYDIEDSETFNQRVTQFAGLLTYDSLGRLSYLHAVITETLRLYPAVPQVSHSMPNTLCKYKMKKQSNFLQKLLGHWRLDNMLVSLSVKS